MEEKKLKPLPLGSQNFKEIIEENNLYVDKTNEILKLVKGNGKYFFLARPRRFGKSLLVTTLEQIFLGNKELFKGLFIYDKIDFKKYPVIKISLNGLNYADGVDGFKKSLFNNVKSIYNDNNLEIQTDNYKDAFIELIKELSKTEKVVLLIDEYDKPITEFIDDITKASEMRLILRDFYEVIKFSDEYLHFVFLTGVSKFSKVSIFSTLNNLTDITMEENYSKIVGIDEEQLYTYFAERITLLAEKKKVTEEYLKEVLKKMYNGYSWDGKNFIYNPYSLLLLFNSQEIKKYWFNTGTPTFVSKLIKTFDIDIKELENCVLREEDFDSYDIDNINPYALLFQTGYLTIKEVIEYDIENREYVLSFPNKEVKDALLNSLLNSFNNNQPTKISINRIILALKNKNLKEFFNILITFFDTIPNQIHPEKGNTVKNKEYYYHTIFHVLFSLIGMDIKSEISTSKGFVDSVVETDKYIYIFEFKLEKNSKIAIDQIKNKKYFESYLSSKKEIILVGVSFDMKERNIKEWKDEIYTVSKEKNND